MVMSYNPKNPPPEPPHHEGPTTAELFCDAMAARRWHQANNPRGTVPADLEIGRINMAHCIGSKPTHEDGAVKRIVFMDGSAAKRNRRGRWVTN